MRICTSEFFLKSFKSIGAKPVCTHDAIPPRLLSVTASGSPKRNPVPEPRELAATGGPAQQNPEHLKARATRAGSAGPAGYDGARGRLTTQSTVAVAHTMPPGFTTRLGDADTASDA